MANDMQWPTEDEDFDATTDADKIKALNNSQPEKLVAKPFKKPVNKVAVAVSEPDAHQSHDLDDEIDRAFAEPVQSREQIEQHPEPEHHQPAQHAPEPAPARQKHHAQEAPEAVPASGAVTEHEHPEHQADQYDHASEPAKAPKDTASVVRTIFELVLVLALLGVGYYAYTLHDDKQNLQAKVATLNANPQIAIQKQTDQLISSVGSLITLPVGETPTVANVSDATKAKQQSSFFTNAQNGDKVLMYVKAGQAILYRPSTSKIILVAPLTFNSDNAPVPSTAPAKTTR